MFRVECIVKVKFIAFRKLSVQVVSKLHTQSIQNSKSANLGWLHPS